MQINVANPGKQFYARMNIRELIGYEVRKDMVDMRVTFHIEDKNGKWNNEVSIAMSDLYNEKGRKPLFRDKHELLRKLNALPTEYPKLVEVRTLTQMADMLDEAEVDRIVEELSGDKDTFRLELIHENDNRKFPVLRRLLLQFLSLSSADYMPHMRRVLREQRELLQRTLRLQSYLLDNVSKYLPTDERSTMQVQLKQMIALSKTLQKRLNAHDKFLDKTKLDRIIKKHLA